MCVVLVLVVVGRDFFALWSGKIHVVGLLLSLQRTKKMLVIRFSWRTGSLVIECHSVVGGFEGVEFLFIGQS